VGLIPALDTVSGAIPVGRYPATLADIHAAFVAGKEPAREKIWDDWQQATALLRQHVSVLAAWVGGSFFTSRNAPNDIDGVYWVEYLDLISARLRPVSTRVIEVFSKQHDCETLSDYR
jgi:hypothetical protein